MGIDLKKVPPYDIEAEREILGAMMMSSLALAKGLEMLKEDDFYDEKHKRIFRAITQLYDEKSTVTVQSIKDMLKRMGELENVGGIEYLAILVESFTTPNIDDWIQSVREKRIYREIIDTCSDLMESAYKEDIPADKLLDLAEQRILEIRAQRVKESFSHVADLLPEIQKLLIEIIQRKKYITGIPSGFKELDNLTSGFQPGDLILVASRPSVGKTAFVLNILRNASLEYGYPTALFSLEMPKQQILLRFLSMESFIPLNLLRTGNVPQEKLHLLFDSIEKIKKTPIYLDDTSSMDILELKAKARRIAKEAKIKIIAVDYLQLLHATKRENRVQEVAEISQGLKTLAKELNIPVIAVSQLSRGPEMRREDKRPRLADLRESGSLEQDADVVIFLYREDIYYKGVPETEKNISEIIVAKNRNGPVDTIKLIFQKEITRFFEGYLSETSLIDMF